VGRSAAVPHPFFVHKELYSVPVPMELSRVIVSEINDQQAIYLKECNGTRMFPILIGPFEAQIINRRLLEEAPFRPLTHDLLKQVIEQLGGIAEEVVITDMREHTYYAVLKVRVGSKLLEIDCRPSDAVALAVHFRPPLPISVAEHVLDSVG
jgi:bifunctional DNase/RNase